MSLFDWLSSLTDGVSRGRKTRAQAYDERFQTRLGSLRLEERRVLHGDPPVANSDSYAVVEDGKLSVSSPGVLSNDHERWHDDDMSAIKASDPEHGTLAFNANGSFTYTPDANFNGVDTFTYRAFDEGRLSNLASVTINVLAANDAPLLWGANDLAAINEDASNSGNQGVLVSSLIAGRTSDIDAGAKRGMAVIGVDDTHGTWQYSTDGGARWYDFGPVTSDSARLLADNSQTRVRFVPDANFNGTAGGLTFRAWDQTQGAAGGTFRIVATGGTSAFSAATATSRVVVRSINDAPALYGANALNSIAEDVPNGSNPGTLVSDLIAGQVSDVDAYSKRGIAVTWVDDSHGTWQYTTDGGSNWYDFGNVSQTNARLLAADGQTRVRFVPDANFNGPVDGLTFRAWDQTQGTAGGVFCIEDTGGSTAFSANQATACIYVGAVNDAPRLYGAEPLANIYEDTYSAGNPGTLVSQLIAGHVSDNDAYAKRGIAVIGVDASHGTWQYSTDGGAHWSDFGHVSSSNARLLAADAMTRVRFVPDANFNGTVEGLTFRAWDQTQGAAGGVFSIANPGGSSAFSVHTATSRVVVFPINDAPVLYGANYLAPISEDVPNGSNPGTLVSDLIAGQVSDVDAYSKRGIAVTWVDDSRGTWQYTTDGGSNWYDFGNVSQTNARLLAADGQTRVRFVPDANFNGLVDGLRFRAWDQTQGTSGGVFCIEDTGGSTAFSANQATACIYVGAVNDAPRLYGANDLPSIDEDIANAVNGGIKVADLIAGKVSDPDAYAQRGIAVVAVDDTNGRWQYSLDEGSTWLDFGAVSESNARLLPASSGALVRFVPNENFNGTVHGLSFRAWDRTQGTAGGTFNIVSTGGATAFSQNKATACVYVEPVNDAPLMTSANDLMGILEDQSPATNVGTHISELIHPSFEDVDAGALAGVAVVGVDDTHGTWQYTTDGGATWHDFGAVSDSNARLLADNPQTRVRFLPNESFNGKVVGLTLRAWDRTQGTAGGVFNITATGGSTAFAADTATAGIRVEAVNDAPVLSGTADLPSITEDVPSAANLGMLVSSLIASQINDVDDGAVAGIAVVSVDNSNGSWQFSTDGGTTWSNFGAVSASNARLLAADSQTLVRFTPNANFSGTSAGLTFRAWDQTQGAAGATYNIIEVGGSSAYSVDTATASIEVIAVADPPVLVALPVTGDEDTAIPLAISAALADVDGSESLEIFIANVPAGATLSAGTSLGGGRYKLTSAELAGLTITPPLNSDLPFTLVVTAKSIEASNGSAAETVRNLNVFVNAVADVPTLNTPRAEGDEDGNVPLVIDAQLTDTDGSESLSIEISGVPAGATLSAGTNLGGGRYLLTPSQLTNLTLTPAANSDGVFSLRVVVTSTEAANGSQALAASTLIVSVIPKADIPLLSITTPTLTGQESDTVPLGIVAALTDTDGSETLKIVLSNVPTDAILTNALGQSFTGKSTYELTPDQLAGLKIQFLNDSTTPIKVEAIATERSSGSTASNVQFVGVDIANVLPQILSLSATQITSDSTTTLSGSVSDVGRDTLTLTINWGDGTTQTVVVGVQNASFQISHFFAIAPDPTNPNAPVPVSVALGDGGPVDVTQNLLVEVAGTGLTIILVKNDSGVARYDFTPPARVVDASAARTVPISTSQTTDVLTVGGDGNAQDEDRVVLRIVSADDQEIEEILLADDALNDLPGLFQKLPDGHYRVYFVQAGTRQARLVIDAVIRQGRLVDPSSEAEGTQDRPPTAKYDPTAAAPVAAVEETPDTLEAPIVAPAHVMAPRVHDGPIVTTAPIRLSPSLLSRRVEIAPAEAARANEAEADEPASAAGLWWSGLAATAAAVHAGRRASRSRNEAMREALAEIGRRDRPRSRRGAENPRSEP